MKFYITITFFVLALISFMTALFTKDWSFSLVGLVFLVGGWSLLLLKIVGKK